MINAVDDGQQNAEKTPLIAPGIDPLAEPVEEKNDAW